MDPFQEFFVTSACWPLLATLIVLTLLSGWLHSPSRKTPRRALIAFAPDVVVVLGGLGAIVVSIVAHAGRASPWLFAQLILWAVCSGLVQKWGRATHGLPEPIVP